MKNFLLSLILTTLVSSVYATAASIKVIYGDDNRVDVIASPNELYVKLAESTAAMISNDKLKEFNAEQFEIGGKTLAESGVCAQERFSQQPIEANCSGFLVGKNTLVTAGHCIRSQFDCDNNAWVFDYKVQRESDSSVVVDKSSVYKCKSIIARELNSSDSNDYAVLELEQDVLDRDVLKFRTSGKPKVGDELVVIGHPTGLPTKISDKAYVREVNDIFLVANLDTYGGNSGSAVFNAVTGEVEGILVRGDTDYIFDRSQMCRVSNRLGENAGRGEDVTLITAVKGLPSDVSEPAPEEPSEPELPDTPSEPEQPEEPSLSWWERLLRWLFGK
ncbi:MAG: peptidase [Halobacteriovoraceae bacterium]|nr:peptidase [Halobacteriovoraceae bacterium]